MIRILTIFVAATLATSSLAQGLILVDPENGHYLGNLNSNKYDPNSVANPYGRYGSQYSPDSINNSYGKYGSPYSPNSANNPYATQSPIIVAPNGSGSSYQNLYDN